MYAQHYMLQESVASLLASACQNGRQYSRLCCLCQLMRDFEICCNSLDEISTAGRQHFRDMSLDTWLLSKEDKIPQSFMSCIHHGMHAPSQASRRTLEHALIAIQRLGARHITSQ